MKAELPFARIEFVVEDWTEEERRRVQMFPVLPGVGTEPIRVIQVYGFARARDDGDRVAKNETFLQTVFREGNSCADTPTVVLGDINIEPEFSATIASEIVVGN